MATDCPLRQYGIEISGRETPAEIDARVKEMMEAAKAGGGYVLMPTAAPINIPLSPRTEANYLAFIEAGYKYGGY